MAKEFYLQKEEKTYLLYTIDVEAFMNWLKTEEYEYDNILEAVDEYIQDKDLTYNNIDTEYVKSELDGIDKSIEDEFEMIQDTKKYNL
ncbi:MAG: hypothetical protein WCK92_10810 [Bacteroidota bacterium]